MTEAAEEALGEDIRGLAKEVRHLSSSYRRARIWNVFLGAALVVGLAGGIAGGVGIGNSDRAINQAASAIDCLNKVLADRNGATARDNTAHRAFVQSSSDFARALVVVLAAPKAEQAADYKKFLVVLDQYERTAAATSKTLRDDQAQRALSPLGKC